MVTFCGLNQSCICIYVSHSFDAVCGCICNSVDLHLLHNSNGFAAVAAFAAAAFRLIHFAHLTIEPRWTPPNANLDLVCLLQPCICICAMPETSVNKYFMRGYKYFRHFRALSQFAHLFFSSLDREGQTSLWSIWVAAFRGVRVFVCVCICVCSCCCCCICWLICVLAMWANSL